MSFSGNQYPNYADKVITTRGDIVRGSSTGDRERLGLGSANQVLQSDGTDIDWETLALADSTLTTQGDVLYQGASGLARLGQSTDGFVLTTKGASANPVWAAVSASGRLEQLAHADTTNTTTDTVTLSFSSIDLNDYSCLMLEFGGVCSAIWEQNLEVLIGSVSSGYRYAYDRFEAAGWTNTNASGQTQFTLADLTAGDWFYGNLFVSAIEQNEGVDEYAANWRVNAFSTDQWIGGGFTNSGSVDITSVTVQVSTDYFAEHCRFNLMGLNRS